MGFKMDKYGFLERPGPDEVDITIRAPRDELRLLAHLVEWYYDGNPTVDNGDVVLPARGLGEASASIMAQFRDQGIEPAEQVPDEEVIPAGTDRPLAARVADEFVYKLRIEVGNHWVEMCRRNREETDEAICHTHDFTDANQVMLDAVEVVMGPGDHNDLKRLDVFEAAWNLAGPRLR